MSVPPLRVPRRLQYRVFPQTTRRGFGHSGVIDLSALEEADAEDPSRFKKMTGMRDWPIVYIGMAFMAGVIIGFTLATVFSI